MAHSTFDKDLTERLFPLAKAVRQYHRHKVIGIENIPQEGPAIIAVSHSLATYDISLLFSAVYESLKRIPRPLADHLFFRLPYLGEWIQAVGATEGNPSNAKKLLADGELLGVAPGGMREALRPSSERYQIMWEKRKGFIKLSLETGAPIIIAVCPKADDIFDVYQSPTTKWAYQKFKIPVFLARGVGLTPIPKPVTLTHFLSEAIVPPAASKDPQVFRRQVDRLHKSVVNKAQKLIATAVAYRRRD